MLSVCPYFHVHQPLRIKRYRVFDVGNDHDYFNDASDTNLNNLRVLQKVARKSYIPANAALLEIIEKHPRFRCAFSFSGIFLDQIEHAMPEVLASFQKLVKTGKVELIADTYHHSLAFFYSPREFERQVALHRKKLGELFGVLPLVFRNTELSYRNDLAVWAEKNGFNGILAEGWDHVLGWRSPNFLYQPKGTRKIKVLLKNYRLSDDMAFRFGERSWKEWPLSAEKFSSWINAIHGNGHTVNLFMDYETFGEHQWEDTGIFNFLKALPGTLMRNPDTTFKTPSETIDSYPTVGEFDVPWVLTWADTERDLSAWSGNEIQKSALAAVYELENTVLASRDEQLIEDWRRLQTSDHFYFMCTKWWSDGDVHKYFSPYDSPYDAFISFMNAIRDVQLRARVAERELPLTARWFNILKSFIRDQQVIVQGRT